MSNSIYLVQEWNLGLLARAVTLWLSRQMMRVDRGTISSYISNHLIYSTSKAAIARARYSDSVHDLKIATCF